METNIFHTNLQKLGSLMSKAQSCLMQHKDLYRKVKEDIIK